MAKWTETDNGWQVWRRPNGADYRLLVSDTGRPRYQGAARRYAEVAWDAYSGKVLAKSAAGYWRAYPTVEEAKAAVTPKTYCTGCGRTISGPFANHMSVCPGEAPEAR
jgi:hypothetical protein